MSVYKTSKKVRYMSSIIFVLLMAFVVGGSYLAQQNKVGTKMTTDSLNNL